MNNDIINILDFNESDEIDVKKIFIENGTKFFRIGRRLEPMYCPICGLRMHSKGIYQRTINHPIFQDGYKTTILLDQRKWICPDPMCKYYCTDRFSFVDKYKQNTMATIYLILKEMKDLNLTARYISRKFNVSDTYIHDIFLQYIDCQRLPLPEILAVDEVFLGFDSYNKYALVLMDFITGELVDILPNRHKQTYEQYFLSIPLEERKNVKLLVCDMYNPYLNFTKNYFYHSEVIIDSFHVIQWINHKINLYINDVKKKYQNRDKEKLKDSNYHNNTFYKTTRDSREVYFLKKHRWVLLKSQKNIKYSYNRYKNRFLGQYYSTYDYEREFMKLDSKFPEIRRLKELYITFNDDFPKSFDTALSGLNNLISIYKNSSISIFRDFADLLEDHKTEICNSFRTLQDYSNEFYHASLNTTKGYFRRISNGPMEGFNRKPKDLKRNSRGFKDINYTINRIIWSNRENEPIRYTPKPLEEVKFRTGRTRGKYNK